LPQLLGTLRIILLKRPKKQKDLLLSFERDIMSYETIANIANISLALSFLVALLFGIFQVRDAAKDRKERRTMEALRSFQSRDFAELDGRLTYHKSPTTFKEFEQLQLHEQAK